MLFVQGSLQYVDSGLDWTGLWTGPWTRSYSDSDQLISLLYFGDLHSFLIQDAPHLNKNICDKRRMKSFHRTDANYDSDQFI